MEDGKLAELLSRKAEQSGEQQRLSCTEAWVKMMEQRVKQEKEAGEMRCR